MDALKKKIEISELLKNHPWTGKLTRPRLSCVFQELYRRTVRDIHLLGLNGSLQFVYLHLMKWKLTLVHQYDILPISLTPLIWSPLTITELTKEGYRTFSKL